MNLPRRMASHVYLTCFIVLNVSLENKRSLALGRVPPAHTMLFRTFNMGAFKLGL